MRRTLALVLLISLAGLGPEALAAEPLKVACYGNYMPLHGEGRDGGMIGLEADLARLIGEKLGREVVLVHTRKEFKAGTLAAVAGGKVDLGINAITPTAERRKTVDFTPPYLELRYRLVGRHGLLAEELPELTDKVAVSSALARKAVEQHLPKATVVQCKSLRQAFARLDKGEAQWVAEEDVGLIKAMQGRGLFLVEHPFGTSHIAIATSKGKGAEVAAVLAGLGPELKRLASKWRPGKPPIPMLRYDYEKESWQMLPPELVYPECKLKRENLIAKAPGLGLYKHGPRWSSRSWDRGNSIRTTKSIRNKYGDVVRRISDTDYKGGSRRNHKPFDIKIEYELDSVGRIRKKTIPFHPGGQEPTKYVLVYDRRGRVTRKVYEMAGDCKGKITTTFHYDDQGRLAKAESVERGRCVYEDEGGRSVEKKNDRIDEDFVYDDNGQLIRVDRTSHKQGRTKTILTLKWDAQGRLVRYQHGEGAWQKAIKRDEAGKVIGHTKPFKTTLEYDQGC
jgi:YD repeat-containing protein